MRIRSNTDQLLIAVTLFFAAATLANAQPPSGFGGRGGPGGPGGPDSADREIVEQFDNDGDGKLNSEERRAALTMLQEEQARGGGQRRGPRGRGNREPGQPGVRMTPDQVETFGNESLYDPLVLRTLFLEFESDDWENELALFKPTDVEVPATLIVDGEAYEDVGVSFRGASSFFSIPSGLKRSFNLSIDYGDEDQRLFGYKTLNLLNCNGDDSMLSSALYSLISSEQIPAPRVNFVRVVVNGESWGIYCNCQQFNKDFLQEFYDTKQGARWKVSGSPRGDGGLRYLGEEIEPYRERFEIKSKDKEESWRDLINLCRVLNETPTDQLADALEPLLNVEGALWFLAVDNALINSDGYWTRASDYSIYQDPDGKFHILPHDMNEAFRPSRGGGGFGGGPGGRGGRERGQRPDQERQGFRGGGPDNRGPQGGERPTDGFGQPDTFRASGQRGPQPQGFGQRGNPQGGNTQRGGGVELDPLLGLDDESKPLRSRLLAVDEFRQQYLMNIREIASSSMSWEKLGPHIVGFRELLMDDVEQDTRKLMSFEAFLTATSPDEVNDRESAAVSLRAFLEQRANYLLSHEAILALPE